MEKFKTIEIIEIKSILRQNHLNKCDYQKQGLFIQKIILKYLFDKDIRYIELNDLNFLPIVFWNAVFENILYSGVCRSYLNDKIRIRHQKIFLGNMCVYTPLSPNEVVLLNFSNFLKNVKPDYSKLRSFINNNTYKIFND